MQGNFISKKKKTSLSVYRDRFGEGARLEAIFRMGRGLGAWG